MLTLSGLRTQLRDLIDEPANAGKAINARLLRWLNAAQTELATEVDNVIEGYYESSETITTTADTLTYALPSDWRSTVRIENDAGANLLPYRSEDFTYTTDTTSETADYFWIQGKYIWLYPTPSTTGETYTHFYLTEPTDMSADGGYPDFPPGHERLLAYKAAIWYAISSGATEGLMALKREFHEELMKFRNYSWQTYLPNRVRVGRQKYGYNYVNTKGRK